MTLYFNPDSVWKPFGAFSMAVVVGSGRMVYLKGQVSLDRDGNLVGRGDMAAQVRQTLDNIAAVLGDIGGEMRDVIALTLFTTDIDGFMACSEIRQDYFSAPFPATTTLEIARLYDPALLVEITAVAEIPEDRFHEGGAVAGSR